MPSVTHPLSVTSLDDDINAIREAVLRELDAGREVMVHAHSWGGIPANSALDGLSKGDRARDVKKGVVKLAFVASFMIPEGLNVTEALGGTPEWWIRNEVSVCMGKLFGGH